MNDVLKLCEKSNYLNKNISYIKNMKITEWDIASAGLSVIKYRKLLTPDEISKLESLPKKERTIKEGLLQKQRPIIAEEIVNTLEKVRKAFVIGNHLTIDSILSIKKDAMFLIDQNPQKTTFQNYFTFRKKEEYTSYIYLNKKEIYVNSLLNTITVKGFSEDIVDKQTPFFLNDIKRLLIAAEKLTKENLFQVLKRYRSQYLNKQLPLETYRNMESGKFMTDNYAFDRISKEELDIIDISSNYVNYLLPLFRALL